MPSAKSKEIETKRKEDKENIFLEKYGDKKYDPKKKELAKHLIEDFSKD